MRLILAIAGLLALSGAADAQVGPWQPMLWNPVTVTPPAVNVLGHMVSVLNGGTASAGSIIIIVGAQ